MLRRSVYHYGGDWDYYMYGDTQPPEEPGVASAGF